MRHPLIGILFVVSTSCSRASALKNLNLTPLLTDAAACQQSLVEQFANKVDELKTALTQRPVVQAKQKWQDVMSIWQHLEMLQIGPLAAQSKGGQDYRNRFYSWPFADTCQVDQILVSSSYSEKSDAGRTMITEVSSLPAPAKTLDALEYLLFGMKEQNTCGPQIIINSNGSWAALSTEEKELRRQAYAQAIATYLSTEAAALVKANQESKTSFVNGGKFSLDAWVAALFYLEIEVKNLKIANPLNCQTGSCPTESPWSNTSLDNIKANVAAFESAYFGCREGSIGLAQQLQQEGAGAVDQRIRGKLSAIKEALVAFKESTLEDAIVNDKAKVTALHQTLIDWSTTMKDELVFVLGLTLPDRVQSDND